VDSGILKPREDGTPWTAKAIWNSSPTGELWFIHEIYDMARLHAGEMTEKEFIERYESTPTCGMCGKETEGGLFKAGQIFCNACVKSKQLTP
jgi:hypothetical protein